MNESLIYSDLLAEEPDLEPIVRNFVSRLPSMVTNLKQSWQQTDWQQLREAAHELKGTSGGLGFPQLMRIADEIEIKAKTQTRDGLDHLIAAFETMCARVSTAP